MLLLVQVLLQQTLNLILPRQLRGHDEAAIARYLVVLDLGSRTTDQDITETVRGGLFHALGCLDH